MIARSWVAPQWGTPENWAFIDIETADPLPGEITVRVEAAGVNPADAKHVAQPRPGVTLPVAIGYEISGEVVAIGEDTAIASGPVAVGDEVIAFRIAGGYSSHVTILADAAFHKPAALSHAEAANLLLVGTTAAEMLQVVGAATGDTIVLHGASGAVGVSVLQQAARAGIRVVGTARAARFDEVRRFGGVPVAYGPGVTDRLRDAADGQIVAALDAVGTDEAIDASLALVRDRSRIVTIANSARATAEGLRWIAGSLPESAVFRDAVRGTLVDLADRGALVVPVSRTYPLSEARQASALLAEGHPGGKIALIP